MKITLTLTTPPNSVPYNKSNICDVIGNAIDELKRNPELILIVGNPARANFETVFGEHVSVKIQRHPKEIKSHAS